MCRCRVSVWHRHISETTSSLSPFFYFFFITFFSSFSPSSSRPLIFFLFSSYPSSLFLHWFFHCPLAWFYHPCRSLVLILFHILFFVILIALSLVILFFFLRILLCFSFIGFSIVLVFLFNSSSLSTRFPWNVSTSSSLCFFLSSILHLPLHNHHLQRLVSILYRLLCLISNSLLHTNTLF